jgi:holo-[acyl-carrier protein] synthase
MKIIGIGLDMIRIDRVRVASERWKDRFLLRVFTETERRYCFERTFPYASLAARFAVKEAVLKALGTGWSQGIRWLDIEVQNDPFGRPSASVGGRTRQLLHERGATGVHISLSHDGEYAVGEAVLTADS